MIDGLALGETTPGPLIVVAASIGLWRLKLGVVQVIGASAAAGLLFSLLVR